LLRLSVTDFSTGEVHQQDAAAERRAETAYRGRGLEGPLIGEHG